MTRRNRRLWQYSEATAESHHICLACNRVIEPGERYTGRRKKFHNGRWGTLAKCGDCVPLKEGEPNE